MMQLDKLLDQIVPQQRQADISLQKVLTGITIDSRMVQPGKVFVALPSVWPGQAGGEQYILNAVKAGASVIITSENVPDDLPKEVIWLQVENPHQTLSRCARAFYPKQPKHIVAVTGTNGKSSVVDFTFQYWSAARRSCAKMGTITVADNQHNGYPGFDGLTTPDALLLHQHLDLMASNGIEYVAMEASSHALQQFRMDSVDIEVALFTNLSQEHLDYHKDAEDYFNAKARLFTDMLPKDGTAIINKDDATSSKLIDILNSPLVTYGQGEADLIYHIGQAHEHGHVVKLTIFGKTFEKFEWWAIFNLSACKRIEKQK